MDKGLTGGRSTLHPMNPGHFSLGSSKKSGGRRRRSAKALVDSSAAIGRD